MGQDLTIREFQEDDAEEFGEVMRKSWFYTYADILPEEVIRNKVKRYSPEIIKKSAKASQFSQAYVAEVEGKVVGIAQPCYYNYWDPDTFDPDQIMLSRIYLDPDYMRQGIGTRLLDQVEKWVSNEGFEAYTLLVHKDNDIGISFYRKHGFEMVEGPNENDEILLKKKLT